MNITINWGTEGSETINATSLEAAQDIVQERASDAGMFLDWDESYEHFAYSLKGYGTEQVIGTGFIA